MISARFRASHRRPGHKETNNFEGTELKGIASGVSEQKRLNITKRKIPVILNI
jgi:hypothetical protein